MHQITFNVYWLSSVDDNVAFSPCHGLNKSFDFEWFYDFIVAFELTQSLNACVFKQKIDWWQNQYPFVSNGKSNGQTGYERTHRKWISTLKTIQTIFRNGCIFYSIWWNWAQFDFDSIFLYFQRFYHIEIDINFKWFFALITKVCQV